MKKYITILSLIVLAACTRDGIPDVPDDGGFTDIALTYTIQTEITSDVHGSTKSDSGISLGSCDIWCFVYDRGSGTWVDGFPAIQTGTDGNRYLFRIPKLDYARLRFVIMSEDIEYSYEGGDIVFSSPDMSAEGSYLYSTDAIELSTNTGRIVNINGKLIQRHYDLNLGFEFNNFNISPEDYFAGWTFELTDKEGNIYPELTISKQNPILYISSDEVLKLLDSGTGIIYIGSPKSFGCREMIPILMSVSAELGVDEVYYFDATSIRDKKERNSETNEIETITEGTEEYYDIVSCLEEYLPAYKELEDETIKRLYFPTVVAVKNGKIMSSHTGSVSAENSAEKLKNIYKDMIEKTRN